ncbi:autotransporter assembly complex protein TamA [Spiribacter roseus]|uniref:autotransporter assembly complex protein TamA n=1 Tax=Spiribacter roseus TaxID=1855875 RepID=UPI001330BCE2|nr:autotransporter assembly complex family protein [Spiribacter roseus]
MASVALAMMVVSAPGRAAVDLTLTGADGALADNLRAHVDTDVSLESDLAGRFYRDQVRESLRDGAEALGYYEARFDITLTASPEDWRLDVAVTPGPRVRVRNVEVRITGDGADDRVLAALSERLPLRAGEPLNHADYERSKRALINEALQRGYFDYRFTTAELAVNVDGGWAEAILVMDAGARYALGEVTFSPSPFRQRFLSRLVPFEPGTPYTAEAVADLNQRLLDSGYFTDARVETRRDAGPPARIPVQADVVTRERNTVTTGAGYSTDEGPRLQLGYQRHYVNNRGHQLSSQLRVSTVRQSIDARYEIPLADPINDHLTLSTAWENADIEDTRSERYSVRLARRQTFTSGWTRTQSLRWLEERFTVGVDSGRSRLVLPGISFSRTRSRGGLDPDWGDQQRYSLEGASEALLSDVDIARLRLDNTWLRSVGEAHRFKLSAHLGGVATSDFEQTPTSLRFFAGGDQSVRGFAYRSLGPKDDNGDVIGGRYLTTGSAEYSYGLTDDWRLATFVDAGNAYREPSAFDPAVGTGFGVRWTSPVGPLRLDLAWGVSREDLPFRLHFSIGPPF